MTASLSQWLFNKKDHLLPGSSAAMILLLRRTLVRLNYSSAVDREQLTDVPDVQVSDTTGDDQSDTDD
ncbi:hypothetical protein BH10BAC2_BH10BAC2_42520 [soil metagenome]